MFMSRGLEENAAAESKRSVKPYYHHSGRTDWPSFKLELSHFSGRVLEPQTGTRARELTADCLRLKLHWKTCRCWYFGEKKKKKSNNGAFGMSERMAYHTAFTKMPRLSVRIIDEDFVWELDSWKPNLISVHIIIWNTDALYTSSPLTCDVKFSAWVSRCVRITWITWTKIKRTWFTVLDL